MTLDRGKDNAAAHQGLFLAHVPGHGSHAESRHRGDGGRYAQDNSHQLGRSQVVIEIISHGRGVNIISKCPAEEGRADHQELAVLRMALKYSLPEVRCLAVGALARSTIPATQIKGADGRNDCEYQRDIAIGAVAFLCAAFQVRRGEGYNQGRNRHNGKADRIEESPFLCILRHGRRKGVKRNRVARIHQSPEAESGQGVYRLHFRAQMKIREHDDKGHGRGDRAV